MGLGESGLGVRRRFPETPKHRSSSAAMAIFSPRRRPSPGSPVRGLDASRPAPVAPVRGCGCRSRAARRATPVVDRAAAERCGTRDDWRRRPRPQERAPRASRTEMSRGLRQQVRRGALVRVARIGLVAARVYGRTRLSSASCGPRHSPGARTAVGDLRAEAIALLPR